MAEIQNKHGVFSLLNEFYDFKKKNQKSLSKRSCFLAGFNH